MDIFKALGITLVGLFLFKLFLIILGIILLSIGLYQRFRSSNTAQTWSGSAVALVTAGIILFIFGIR
jgi:cytochrome c oxidase assembly factor CtaG